MMSGQLTKIRYTPHPSGYQSAVQLSEEYASQARKEVDTDEPSVDALQALLLLVTAFTAAGKGKKAYMLLSRSQFSKMMMSNMRIEWLLTANDSKCRRYGHGTRTAPRSGVECTHYAR